MKLSKLLMEAVKENLALDYLSDLVKNNPEWKGHTFLAGGAVRDEVMGKDIKDIDLVVSKPNGGIKFAEEICKKLGIYKPGINPVVFERFGTAKFNLRGISYQGHDLSDVDIECVMTRGESYEKGSRKPEVTFADLRQDVERRDFTVNSLLKDLSTGEILDLTGKGIHDIKHGVVRSTIDPNIIFKEDPLRMLRAIRFATKYNWKLPQYMINAIHDNAASIKDISSERVQDELSKMLLTDHPDKAIRLMQITKLTDYTIPELNAIVRMKQGKHHVLDVNKHTMEVLKKVPADLITRLAALFHDIGKGATKTIIDNEIHFYEHEEVGADMAEAIMKRLRYPNHIIEPVVKAVRNHMRLKGAGSHGQKVSDKALRKFQVDLGDHLQQALDVMHADNISHAPASNQPYQIPGIRNRMQTLKLPQNKITLPINGNDIMQAFNIKPGPMIKDLLGAVTDAYLENPNLTAQDAMKVATDKYQELTTNPSINPSILDKKITNPDTGNLIKIKSALDYDKSTAVYKAAKDALDRHQSQ